MAYYFVKSTLRRLSKDFTRYNIEYIKLLVGYLGYCFHRTPAGFPLYFSLKVQNVRHTNDRKCSLPTRRLGRGEGREVGMEVSLGDRESKKELEPAERERWSEGAPLLSSPLQQTRRVM